MAQTLHLKTKCPQCVGSGEYVPPGGGGPLSCPMCSATGWLDIPPYVQKIELDPGMDDIDGKLDTLIGDRPTILEKFNTIIDKCDEILALLSS